MKTKLKFRPGRFRKMIAVMRKVKPEKHDQTTFGCGTRGCIAHHYVKKGKPVGLRLTKFMNSVTISTPNKTADVDETFLNLAEHFGITYSEADDIFGPDSCTTPAEAVAMLEEFYNQQMRKVKA